MPEYVAMLRGINVGGRNKLPMRELAALFAGAGCDNVETYIQSGNVIFDASREVAANVSETMSHAIEHEYGYHIPVIVRTAAQMANVVDSNPWIPVGVPEAMLHVYFLETKPERDRVSALDPERSPGDTFAVLGQEVYLNLANGMARTKLTNAYFDSALQTMTTGRNWRTVTKLHDLLRD